MSYTLWISGTVSGLRGLGRRETRFARAFAALGALLACAACSESSAPAAAGGDVAAAAAAPSALRVGLLTPGSIQDAGWNQGAYEGLLHVKEQLGAEIAHQQTATPAEFEVGFRDLAARDFDLVFGHGFEFQDAAAKVGAEFPDCVFITTSGNTIRDNVAPIVFELEQATYVLGFVGGKLSRSGKLAALGGMEIPSVASTFSAFEAGMRAARADAVLSRAYIGSWEDVAAAREATLAQLAQGADVLIHNADAAGQGFFQAVREQPQGVFAFGTNADQNALAPERVLASATLDIPRAMLLVAQEVQGGKFKARSIEYGLADGVIGIAWNAALAGQIDPALRAQADAIAEQIRSGSLKVQRGF